MAVIRACYAGGRAQGSGDGNRGLEIHKESESESSYSKCSNLLKIRV